MDVLGYGGVRLNVLDLGGSGRGILLLHGLTDRASTWTDTAQWLTAHGHVYAYDARGHGYSDKPDGPYDRDAYVGDAAAVIEALELGPALVVGHSMGGLTAWQLAGRRPDLVRGIVVGDMNPVTPADGIAKWQAWLDDWPVPFPTLARVREYFEGTDPGEGGAFPEVMTGGPDGWRPLVRTEHVLATLEHWMGRDHRPELAEVTCPALVVAGAARGRPVEGQRESARLLRGRYVELPRAGHVVHFSDPAGWRAAVEPFAAELA
ncbi:alpha/beta fold hydrolase [Catellatospora tritici]|uniref:alpha/beta fold hydrolase n=1 Tax=Catellatospora tritici TaxID=2851566 RepID=UPI001C2CCB54|nr:alpha/beta hydrolase [Catellatospora tritici]MBV1855495.1 alpha/beta hydrolase [Catellatospora tritici]